MMITRASEPGYVPAGYGGPNAPEWATQAGGPSNLPKPGWTAQNGTGSAFISDPYVATEMGVTPDWTGIGGPREQASGYDMNQAVSGIMAPNGGTAPIGGPDGMILQYDDVPNPTSVPEGSGSLQEPLEY